MGLLANIPINSALTGAHKGGKQNENNYNASHDDLFKPPKYFLWAKQIITQ